MIERLNKLVEFKNGKKRPTEKGVIPVYGGNGILGYTNQFNAERNNLIIGRVGAYCGCVYKCNGKCWISDNAIVGNVRRNADYNFAYYLLKSLKLNKRHIGSGQPLMTQSILNSIEVEVPGYSTQKRIGKILNDIDSQIDANNRTNDNLHDMAEMLFRKVYEKGHNGKLERFLSNIESGARPKGGAEATGVPSVGAEKIERFGIYDYSSEKYIGKDFYNKMKRGRIKNGDVLLYKDGAYTGKSSMVLDGFPHKEAAVNEHVFILNTENNFAQFYLYFCINIAENREKLHTLASGKAAQPGLNQSELGSIDIMIPDRNSILDFENNISPIMHQIASNAQENRRLTKLRDTLLPELLNGKIDISNIDI